MARETPARFDAPGEPTGFSDLRDHFPAWHDQAACRGEQDEKLFFQEPTKAKTPPNLSSASMLLPLLICAECPARAECLRAAFEPPAFNVRPADEAHHPVTFGCWGGTWDWDRHQVKDLSSVDAIASLEASFGDRLAMRIDAWRGGLTERRAKRAVVGKRDERIEQMLGVAEEFAIANRVKRFHLTGPGPGRGHRGPIATYAAAHGVSRSTAWRRLRAS